MLLEQFLKYIQYEKRYSQHTLTAYKKDLSQYHQFINSLAIEVLQANHHTIRSWMVSLMDENIDARSINRKISALRSFYKFLIKENFLIENPVIKVQTPKAAKRLPTFIPDEKLNSLLDNKDSFSDDFSGLRDKLVIEILFGTGIRLSELLNLTINSVKAQERTIKVLGKRNKERIVPVNQSLFSLIENYNVEKNKQEFSNNSNSLIVTNKGAAAYPKLIYRLVQKYLSTITTLDKRSPHVLRHSFATSLLNKGADINAIKELLGHANLAATQVYTHNSIERLKSIYKQAHPKA